MLNFNHLTMAEITTIEKLADLPITSIQTKDAPKGRALAAMALVAKRRTGEAGFTWDQAQELTLSEVNEVLAYYQTDDGADEPDEPDEVDEQEQASAVADDLGRPVAGVGDLGNVEGPAAAPTSPPID